MGRFLSGLDHQQAIVLRVEIGKQRVRVGVKLVAEDQEEAAHGVVWVARALCRQASEQ
jgi:hypothetical protein